MAAQAARAPPRVCTPLAHLIDADVLREASRHTRQARAPGLDGVTAAAYAAHLAEHRRARQARLRSGRAQAAPVERVWSAQEDGRPRPRGPPTCADKRGQRAVARRRAALYAQDVLDCSYGFRPGCSPQAALHEGRARCLHAGRGWSGDAEVSGAGASLDRPGLREGLRKRGTEGRRGRLLGKGRRAGVRDHGELTPPEPGGGPGGGISPGLATSFLQQGREEWCEREGQPRLKGRSVLTRLAEACVRGCALAADAQKSMAVLPKRCARFGLRSHPTKTTRVVFRKPTARQAAAPGNGTGEVLGFTHYWARTRRGGGGSHTQHSQATAPAAPAGVVAMVSPQPPCASALPRLDAGREAPRALPVLRESRQLPSAGERPSLGGEGVALWAAAA
jgi:RNA-directed DNA polymerase